ncbi:MAG: DUF2586 domain-containing protein [Cellvibrionaceae bacterium]
MAQGKVTVNNQNLGQGTFNEVERVALFIGLGGTGTGTVLAIDTQTDLDVVLGSADSEIKTNVAAAKANGGENWLCYALPCAADYDLVAEVVIAMDSVSPEFVVVCTPATESQDLNDDYLLAEQLRTQFARRVIVLRATPGIDPGTQTWAQYQVAQIAIVDGVKADRVGAVPQLHGNDLGVLVGRLCNRSFSIADSPMRVKSDTVLGLGAVPVDSEGVSLPSAILTALDANRLSCKQEYIDFDGTYWGDCNLLDAEGGDYQVVENLRVVDKAARAVRILAIRRVADRSFNDSPESTASTKTYFSRPLREMSHSTTFAGSHFPGDIRPPEADAVAIVWKGLTVVDVYIKVQPWNSPKTITANLVLDLSTGTAA